MSTETCGVCGAPLAAGALRCPSCGVDVSHPAADSKAAAERGPTEAAGEAPAAHGVGWYRAAVVLLGFLFVASALAVLHMELALR